MNRLAEVTRLYVPTQLALDAHAHLRRTGARGYEAFALWAGVVEAQNAFVRATYIPVQEGLRLQEGLCVIVDGPELHRLNVWLYEHKLTLIAQLHSHPDEAYHSETDDAFPIVTTVGGLSLVLPDFARDPFSFDRCAVYRLSWKGEWDELSAQQIRNLMVLVEGE